MRSPGNYAICAKQPRELLIYQGNGTLEANSTQRRIHIAAGTAARASGPTLQLVPLQSVSEGFSPNICRYSLAKRPSSQKPYLVAVSVTLIATGSLFRSSVL